MPDSETIPRKPKWDHELVSKFQALPWATVNGVRGDHIPVEINSEGIPTKPTQEKKEEEPELQFEEDVDMSKRP